MLFWTVVFLTLNFVLLVKGNIFYNSTVTLGEETLKKYESGLDNKKFNEKQLKAATVLALFLPLFIIEFIYFVKALSIDPLKYPTIGVFLLLILSAIFVRSAEKRYDLKTEEGRMRYKAILYKKRSFSRIIRNLVYFSYFSYIFYILVF